MQWAQEGATARVFVICRQFSEGSITIIQTTHRGAIMQTVTASDIKKTLLSSKTPSRVTAGHPARATVWRGGGL